MLFTTKDSVLRKIEGLLVEFEDVDQRVQGYEHQVRVMQSIFGDSPEVAEMRGAHDDIVQTLRDSWHGIRAGLIDHRVISKQLPSVRQSLRHINAILDQADADANAGREAFHARFGKGASC